MNAIESAEMLEPGLRVKFRDGREDVFQWMWLRDHCREPDSYDTRTAQRELWTADLPANVRADSFDLSKDGTTLSVRWRDEDLTSRYDASFLAEFVLTPGQHSSSRLDRKPESWDTTKVQRRLAPVAYADLEKSGVAKMLDQIDQLGFALIQGCPQDPDSVARIARGVGYVRETIFGGIWSFESNDQMADTAYTPKALRPHTDSTYSHDAPGLQLLLCLAYEAEGGESVLVDGLRIAERLRDTHPAAFETLTRIPVPGQYLGDGAHLVAERPAIRLGANGQVEQISFNNYDRAPFRLPDADMAAFYEAIRAFDLLANDPDMQWRKILAPGELIIFDNWRVLHGRSAFSGYRKMAGCYLNREDFESALRVGQ